MKVRLENVRCSFLHCFRKQQPAPGTDGKPAFACHFLIEPGSDNHKKVSAAIQAVAKEKWGAKGPEMVKSLKAKDQLCLHDGTEKAIKYPEYEGMKFVSARAQVKPTIFDQLRNPLSEDSGKPYSGCYCNGSIDVYVSTTGKTWITAQFAGIQFAGDGDAFGGGRPADRDDFDDIAVEGGDAGNDPWGDDAPAVAGSDLV